MALTDLDISLVRNMMLTHSYREIASAVEATVEEVGACLREMIEGTAIVTRQMLIDQKKTTRPQKKTRKKQRTTKQTEKEWHEQKAQKVRNDNERIQVERDRNKNRRFFLYETRNIDYRQLVRVQIDQRTSIFIKPSENPEEAKARYFKNRVKFNNREDIY